VHCHFNSDLFQLLIFFSIFTALFLFMSFLFYFIFQFHFFPSLYHLSLHNFLFALTINQSYEQANMKDKCSTDFDVKTVTFCFCFHFFCFILKCLFQSYAPFHFADFHFCVVLTLFVFHFPSVNLVYFHLSQILSICYMKF
jgi:hypothetical protein